MSDEFNYFGGQKLSYEKRQQMKQAINTVFKNSDPFGEMFQDTIKEKILLHTEGYYLNKRQFEALIKTIKMLGETSFYVSRIEGSDLSEIYDIEHRDYHHWEFSIETPYEKYSKIGLTLENALYSPSGTWGVIISHEEHAVIGGTDEFMTFFKKSYPYWENDLKEFIIIWKFNQQVYKADISWLPDFLSYVDTFKKPRIKLDSEKWNHMKHALTRVFKDMDFTKKTFQDSIQANLLLVIPINSFYLSQDQFEALSNILEILNESSFYVSQVNDWSLEVILSFDAMDDDHFELKSNLSYEEYKKNIIAMQNILYSANGTWGIFISEDGHAVIGGSHEFIELFKKFYPNWEKDIKAFCKMHQEKNGSIDDISWIPDVLKYFKI